MNSRTQVIAYRDIDDGTLLCLKCTREANAYFDAHAWLHEPHIEDSGEYEPYLESDRQGGEVCDVCYTSI